MMSVAPYPSVVVATDFSPSAERAVDRACRLPLGDGARLTLVHVVSRALFSSWGEAPRRDAEAELQRVHTRVASATAGRAEVSARIVVGTPYAEIARVAREQDAELVVLGRTGRSPLRDNVLGTTAEQVVRNGATSVLLVRNARVLPYGRPICAVDSGGVAAEVVAAALRTAPEATRPLTVLHAYVAPYERMFFPSLLPDRLRDYRADSRAHARAELHEELLAAGLPARSWSLLLRHGAARARVPNAVETWHADLLALGTHGRRGPAFALLGSVAGDILRDVRCDTLVVRTSGVTLARP